MKNILILVILTFSTFLAFGQNIKDIQIKRQKAFAIKNVNVITMNATGTFIENATVVISDNIIQSINGTIPKKAIIIDGKGKWLIPGLIDAHVHLPTDGYFGQKLPTQISDLSFDMQAIMTPIIANGVTTVIDLNSTTLAICRAQPSCWTNRRLSRAGLSGRSFIPLLSSFACAIPGIMATRTITNWRDRLATIMIAPLIACSARIPVYTLIIAALFPGNRCWPPCS